MKDKKPSTFKKVTYLKDRKTRTVSSQRWLLRQLNDPYVHQAKVQGYRSRAAFKLIEIDQKYHILKAGMTVIDLGAAPGGWSQIAAKKIGAKGTLIAVDLQEIVPIPTVHIVQGDFLEQETLDKISLHVSEKVDLVMSDMAAPACGIPNVDHIRIMEILENVYDFCLKVLKPNGAMIAKVLRGGAEQSLLQSLKKSFTKVHHFKPSSSRQDSAEMYLVALGFRHKEN